ncbi:MAG: hypothetical protein JEZ00_01340 [Anaerolineaceae bacterium]|nr:hypothetical protein [Anaerolineaceae bacterium]
MNVEKRKNILGWIAVGISLLIALLWTIWGMLENFHEGWYASSIWQNLFLMLIQYIPFSLAFILMPLIAMRWRRMGLIIYIGLGIFCAFFFAGASFFVTYLMLAIPLTGLGLLFFFGNAQPRRLAVFLLTVLPISLMIIIAIPNIIRIQARLNDGDFSTRLVDCQGQPLYWAGRGPGFPEQGVTWADAQDACTHLSADGTELFEDEQNLWRLPDIEEAVRCQTRDGENAGGTWDAENETANYLNTPDKESPIWDSYSEIIYYWTGEWVPDRENYAYIIDYKGGIFKKNMLYSPAYQTFRCVKVGERK